jgi:HSP20 family molecular chaperone IbpA
LADWLRSESELLSTEFEIIERDDGITVRIEVPGYSKDDLDVSIEHRTLSVSGPGLSAADEFALDIDLPASVDFGNAVASLAYGILEIEIPRSESAAAMTGRMQVRIQVPAA